MLSSTPTYTPAYTLADVHSRGEDSVSTMVWFSRSSQRDDLQCFRINKRMLSSAAWVDDLQVFLLKHQPREWGNCLSGLRKAPVCYINFYMRIWKNQPRHQALIARSLTRGASTASHNNSSVPLKKWGNTQSPGHRPGTQCEHPHCAAKWQLVPLWPPKGRNNKRTLQSLEKRNKDEDSSHRAQLKGEPGPRQGDGTWAALSEGRHRVHSSHSFV